MKKFILGGFLFCTGLGVVSAQVLSITPEQLCNEYAKGNSSLVQKKYKGQVIKDTGKLKVSYTEGGVYTSDFYTLSTRLKKKKNYIDLKGFASPTQNDNEYINLDGKIKTIHIKINEISYGNYLLGTKCTIDGTLINYE